VFKWLTSSNRSWEWYLYIQGIPNVNPNLAPAVPARVQGATGARNTLAWSTAISVSGSQSENPWGGTTGSLGSDTKGNPVWVSSSNDYNLYVCPRSNSAGGSHATARDNLGFATFLNAFSNNDLVYPFIISDDDSLLFSSSGRAGDEDYTSFTYLGTYEPFCSVLSQSIKTPFVTFCHAAGITVRPFANTDFGDAQATLDYGAKAGTGNTNGGIVGVTGVRTVTMDFPSNKPNASGDFISTLQPNAAIESVSSSFGSEYSTLPVPLFASTSDDQPGFLGFINTQIFKQAPTTPNYLINNNGTRMTFWPSNATNTSNAIFVPNSFITPWRENIPPRDVAVNRDGLYQGDLD
jgi:hypothetical protein